MSKIIVHQQTGHQTMYYTSFNNQRYTLIVNSDETIDPKSIMPFVVTKNKLNYIRKIEEIIFIKKIIYRERNNLIKEK